MAIIAGNSGQQESKFCEHCQKMTLHESNFLVIGCFLTLITCGLALAPVVVGYFSTPHYRCQKCGTVRKP